MDMRINRCIESGLPKKVWLNCVKEDIDKKEVKRERHNWDEVKPINGVLSYSILISKYLNKLLT